MEVPLWIGIGQKRYVLTGLYHSVCNVACSGRYRCLLACFMVYGVSHTLGGERRIPLMATVYSCSIFAWILLVNLWKLLANIRRGMPFETSSVKYLRISSWCCAGVCAICLLGTLYYTPLILVSIVSGFMALIVRIIKNVFEQAIAMKTELDYTV